MHDALLGRLLLFFRREQVFACACLRHGIAKFGAPVLEVLVYEVGNLRALLLKSLLLFALSPFAVLPLQVLADRFEVHPHKPNDFPNNLVAGVQFHRSAHVKGWNGGLIVTERWYL